MIRRSFIKLGGDLAIDFANTAAPEGERPEGDRQDSLGSWRDLIDFLELRGAVSRDEGVGLRAMGERDEHACAAAFERAPELRATVRAMLEALVAAVKVWSDQPTRTTRQTKKATPLVRGGRHGALHLRGRVPGHLPEEPRRAYLPRHRPFRPQGGAVGHRL